jgi:arylsulfatase A-like enzyme
VRPELLSHADFAPTWLQIAGVPVPAKVQGRSFLPLLTATAEYRARTEIFAERNWHDNFDPIRTVRTDKYKLIFNAAPHFPYRPADDLAASPTWRSIQELGRQGKLTAPQLRMLEPARPVLEFYDLQSDPNEFSNLATSTSHREAMEDCLRRISTWMHATYDFLPPARSAPGEPVAGRGWPTSL